MPRTSQKQEIESLRADVNGIMGAVSELTTAIKGLSTDRQADYEEPEKAKNAPRGRKPGTGKQRNKSNTTRTPPRTVTLDDVYPSQGWDTLQARAEGLEIIANSFIVGYDKRDANAGILGLLRFGWDGQSAGLKSYATGLTGSQLRQLADALVAVATELE